MTNLRGGRSGSFDLASQRIEPTSREPRYWQIIAQLRAALYAEFPHLARLDEIAAGNVADIRKLAGAAIKTTAASYTSPVADFYLTNPIARASATMGECAALAAGLRQAAE